MVSLGGSYILNQEGWVYQVAPQVVVPNLPSNAASAPDSTSGSANAAPNVSAVQVNQCNDDMLDAALAYVRKQGDPGWEGAMRMGKKALQLCRHFESKSD